MLPLAHDRLRRTDWAVIILLVLGTAVLYWQVQNFDYVRFDDPIYVSQNAHVQSGLNLSSIRYALTTVIPSNWTPLTYLTELLIVQCFGSSAAVFHTFCASLHAANIILLYLFLRKSTGRLWPSAIAAMLWGWHPLRVESVAWVGELRDVLCGFFWLATMLAYASFRRTPTLVRYAAVILCTALAMLAKPMAVVLPPTLLLLNYWPLRKYGELLNRKYWTRRLLELTPLFILCIVISAIAVHTQSESGTVGSLSDFPISLRLSNAIYSYLRYISKEWVPIHLGLIYPHPGMLGKTVPIYQWTGATMILLLITAIVWHYRRSKPPLIVGWFWFVGTLVPVIGLVQLGEAALADRYTYLPAIGFTVAMVWLLCDWITTHPTFRIPAILLAAIAITSAAAISAAQISYWRNSHTLMLHSNAVIPDDFLAQGSLSMDASSAGNIPEAIRLARSAIALVPTNEEAHHALAIALQADGQPLPALKEYALAIKYDPTDPGIRVDAGRLLAAQNKPAAAIKQFEAAIDLAPEIADAHHYLAAVLADQGNYDQAIAQWQIAVTLNPHFGLAHGLLADALRLRGDRAGATQHYQAALSNGQSNPQWKANLVWEMSIDPSTTQEQLQQLLPIARQACEQTNQQSPFPLYAYSLAVARLGRFDDATDLANTALRLAQSSHQSQLATDIQKRLNAYHQGKIAPDP